MSTQGIAPLPAFSVGTTDAVPPLILAVDVGSSGVRSGLYDALGRPVRGLKAKLPHAFLTLADGTSVIDPDHVTDAVARVIDLVASKSPDPIAGVALDTFAPSVVGVDAEGAALTPCYTYADSRPAPHVAALRALLGEEATQQRTGHRAHSVHLAARFLWLRHEDPATFARADRWLSLGEYALLRLIGRTAAGTSIASWTGMLNCRAATWDATLCDVVGVRPDQFSPVAPPSEPLTPRFDVGSRWPMLRDAVWFAPIADGFAQSLGLGVDGPDQAVLSAATSGALRAIVDTRVPELPRGLWCNRVDERRSILGGALNDVGRAVAWLEATLHVPPQEESRRMLAGDPLPNTPLVLPWFSGERSTGWAGDARAVFTGVSAATTPWELYRGTLEGIALAYARVLTELAEVTGRPRVILGTGRITLDLPGLLQVVADATGVPVTPVPLKRSTLHGTALHALDVLAPNTPRTPVGLGHTCEPIPARADYYADRAARFQELYERVVAPS